MNTKKRKNTNSGIVQCLATSLALCLSLAGPAGLRAQETANSEAFELESLVVEGYKDSLRMSMQAKRSAVEVSDLILAEDIGQFPDENVGEALQRITGVQLQRDENGEGTVVSVRGVEPDLNLVTIDGRPASSGGFARAFDFSNLSADLVSSLKVVKSQSADMIEGGIGAIIQIKTPKPLNYRDPRVGRINVQFSQLDLTGDWANKYSGLFSQQWADRTQGFLLSYAYEENVVRTDRFGNNGWVRNAVEGGQDLFTPRFFLHHSRVMDRERSGFTGSYQWKPSDQFLLTLSGNLSEYSTFQVSNGYNVNTPNQSGAFPDILDNYIFNENGTGVAFDGPTNQSVPIQENFRRKNIVDGFGAQVEWKLSDRLSADFDAAFSESYSDSNPDQVQQIRWIPASRPPATYTLPEGGRGAPDISLVGLDPTDHTLYNFRQLNLGRDITENEETALAVDLDYDFEEGFFSKFETGLRWSERITDRPRAYNLGSIRPPDFNVPGGGVPTPESVLVPFPVDDFLASVGADVIREWMVVDQDASIQYLRDQGYGFDLTDPWSTALERQIFDVQEEVNAAYAKMNFETLWGEVPISGNFGTRYTETNIASTGAQTIGSDTSRVTLENDYGDWLPSFTFVAKPRQDVVLRLAGSRVMTRPNLNFLTVNQTVNFERVPKSINNGNPFLDPYRADTLDLSAEWYVSDIDSFTFALFQKKVESYVNRAASTVPFREELAPGVAIAEGEEVAVNQPENLDGDTIEGFEVSYQKAFVNLPVPFDGLGFTTNYTYTKSGVAPRNFIFADADLRNADGTFPESALVPLPLPGNSKHSYNLVAFYDKGPFSARFAYNWREGYLINPQFHQNAPLMRDDYGQWDARMQYRINDKIKLTFDAINFDDSSIYEYYAQDLSSPNPDAKERIRLVSFNGAKYNVGVTYSF